jgi:hypothetical protein
MIAGLRAIAPNRERRPRSAPSGDDVPTQPVSAVESQPATGSPPTHELQTPPTQTAAAGTVVTMESSPPAVSPAPTANDTRAASSASPADENATVELGRIAWFATMLACLVAVAILVLEGYYGYAAVTFAVALSAGINLF